MTNEKDKIKYHLLPPHMIEGVRRYIEDGLPTGNFLRSIFSNDLMSTLHFADDINQANIWLWAQFIYNEMPGNSHGSPQIVKDWIKGGGLNGLHRKAEEDADHALPEEMDFDASDPILKWRVENVQVYLPRFCAALLKALDADADSFYYRGNEFVVAYAKYLFEYIAKTINEESGIEKASRSIGKEYAELCQRCGIK